jgi:hypothetical protein
MQHLRIATLLVFGIVALGGVETAWADMVYSFTTLDGAEAYGITDSGQTIEWSPVVGGGVLNADGSFTPINVPGASSTVAYGINNSG